MKSRGTPEGSEEAKQWWVEQKEGINREYKKLRIKEGMVKRKRRMRKTQKTIWYGNVKAKNAGNSNRVSGIFCMIF